jgi:four helix bundle suffix protein
MASGTSKKTEIRLVAVARASLEELLLDYEDYLRQHALTLWRKDDPATLEIRGIGFKDDRTNESYRAFIEDSDATTSANTMICMVHQTNYLLDQLLRHLEGRFLVEGGFSERLYNARMQFKKE